MPLVVCRNHADNSLARSGSANAKHANFGPGYGYPWRLRDGVMQGRSLIRAGSRSQRCTSSATREARVYGIVFVSPQQTVEIGRIGRLRPGEQNIPVFGWEISSDGFPTEEA